MKKAIIAAAVTAAALSLATPAGAAPVNGRNTLGPFNATCTGVGAPGSVTGLHAGNGAAVFLSTGRVLVLKELRLNGVLVKANGGGIAPSRLWTCTGTVVENGVTQAFVAKVLPTR